ncbi:MAG: GDP-mannose 4,6-dehydratase [Chitinophagaceae bacterium]|nr:GDP-mannose 4,6-dehydratase [Chitinophagaceae bacterium]
MSATAIIFGINGQDGFYLSRFLESRGVSVIGISRKDISETSGIHNFEWVKYLIERYQPEYIFHFAAVSTTSHQSLFDNYQAVSTGAINILEAAKVVSRRSKIFISGSGLQFKNTGLPIKESDPFEARDAYSLCRIQSAYAARYYRSLGLKTYIGYFFNHDSPRRTERHVSKMIANAVKSIAKGEDVKVEIGDISVVKEWTFAGDIVNAVWTFVQQEEIGEAVLGSGEGYSIMEYIKECFALIDKDWEDYVVMQNDFKPEYKRLVSDPSLIYSLGWKPEISFSGLVKMMIGE